MVNRRKKSILLILILTVSSIMSSWLGMWLIGLISNKRITIDVVFMDNLLGSGIPVDNVDYQITYYDGSQDVVYETGTIYDGIFYFTPCEFEMEDWDSYKLSFLNEWSHIETVIWRYDLTNMPETVEFAVPNVVVSVFYDNMDIIPNYDVEIYHNGSYITTLTTNASGMLDFYMMAGNVSFTADMLAETILLTTDSIVPIDIIIVRELLREYKSRLRLLIYNNQYILPQLELGIQLIFISKNRCYTENITVKSLETETNKRVNDLNYDIGITKQENEIYNSFAK